MSESMSRTTDLRWSCDFRFTPDSDQTAAQHYVTLGARSGLMQRSMWQRLTARPVR